jgi:hypothetical protein
MDEQQAKQKSFNKLATFFFVTGLVCGIVIGVSCTLFFIT